VCTARYRGFESHSLRHRFKINNLKTVIPPVILVLLSYWGMNKTVSLTKRVITPNGKRYCPVAISANNRIKPDYVIVNGTEEKHPEGGYYLSFYRGAKRIRIAVGKDAAVAQSKKLRKEAELKAVALGAELVSEVKEDRKRLDTAIATYLNETAMGKKPKTLAAYTTSLGYFAESCLKVHVEAIERTDLLEFAAFLRDDKELLPRTCWNKFSNVMSFLKAQGVTKLAKKEDWPRFVEAEVETYEEVDLDALFAACAPADRLLFRFFLMTGLREQEVMYCTWKDINFVASTVSVRHKPQYGWSPKAYKEREVPIPAALLKELREAKEKATSPLLYPTGSGQPDSHMLRTLKRTVEDAGLDPAEFFLHKFRATFATTCLQSGIDLKTVQQWLGHTDLASTMRYLRAARGAGVKAKVEAVWKLR
jgi:integrase/recombinase XerD